MISGKSNGEWPAEQGYRERSRDEWVREGKREGRGREGKGKEGGYRKGRERDRRYYRKSGQLSDALG